MSRNTFFAIFLVCLCGSMIFANEVNSQKSKSSLHNVNVDLERNLGSLKQIFNAIENQTDFEFSYFKSTLSATEKKIDLGGEKNLGKILNIISEKSKLNFKRVNNRIYISIPEQTTERELIKYIEAQADVEISGKITDENGQGLPGASVVQKGTTNGTTTDLEGKYKLNVAEGSMLTISFVGYKTKELTVGSESVIDIQMNIDAERLDEIVVVGYGTEKKINLTGSVSNISTDDIGSRPVTNISAGLSGLAPGVLVTQSNGGVAGGDGGTIRIRGIGTFNDSNPLIVVDGIPSSGTGIMNDIDPNDIENISVLKDAASAAIYGSRGANGVILITTKRGVAGKPTFTYNGYVGSQAATRRPEYVSDFATYMEHANINRGTDIFDPDDIEEWRNNPNDPLRYPNVDWYEEQVGGTAKIQSHNLSFSGGTDATQYRFSLSYLDQDGLISSNNIKRYGFRTNLQSEVVKRVKIGGDLFFRWTELVPSLIGDGDEINHGTVPGMPSIQHPDGRWGGPQQPAVGTVNNSFATIENRVDKRTQQRLLGSVFASWEVIDGLTATAKLALNYNHQVRNTFNKRYDLWDFRRDVITRQFALGTGRSASSRQDQDYLLTSNLLLEYQKSLGDHNFKILGGYESLQFRDDFVSASMEQFQNNEVQAINAGLLVSSTGGNTVEWTLQSYFGRMNYNFQQKYFLEANFRADGSSRFKDGNRWGYFPAFSAAWLISNEVFMKNLDFLDNLKIRASWGKLGNNRIGNYPYQPTYNLNQNYTFGGVVYTGIAQNSLVNEDILWEETTTSDIGIDASWFSGRLTFAFDYFRRETEGILTGLPIPRFLGDKSNPTVNLASMVNKGIEVSLGYRGKIGEFAYSVSGHITHTDNEVTDYFEDIVTGGTQIGFPYNSFYGLEAIDIFRTQEQLDGAATHSNSTDLGDIQFKDQITEDTDNDGIPDAGNGVIDSNDRVIIGNRIPKFIYGGNIGLQFKGFDLGIIIQGIANRDVNTLGQGVRPIQWSDRGSLHQRWVDDSWSSENTSGILPRLNEDAFDGLNDDTSTFWVKDLSFFRVKNLQLGYNLPTSLIEKYGMQKFRVYFSADNLLTISNEEWGFDPETISASAVPNVRTLILGVNIGF
ncbi:MAG: TonB-dependent receptor [Cyclobacteriaceae bacterium]